MADESVSWNEVPVGPSGRLGLVTGSRGIAAEIVRYAVGEGDTVLFTYNKNEAAAVDLVESCKDSGGVAVAHAMSLPGTHQRNGIDILLMDLETDALARDIEPRMHFDYVISCAAVEMSGALGKHKDNEVLDALTANTYGNFQIARYMLAHPAHGCLVRNGGALVFVGSLAADGNQGQTVYSGCKSFLRGFVSALQYEPAVHENNVSVRLIEPAFVQTDMARVAIRMFERAVKQARGEDAVAKLRDLGFIAQPADVARAIYALTQGSGGTVVRTYPASATMQELISYTKPKPMQEQSGILL